jgi:O-antigen/teichoic acid export membrane protein
MGTYQISDVRGRHTDGTYVAARICTSIMALLCFAGALYFTDFSRATLLCCFTLMIYRLLEGFAGVYLCVLQKFDDYKTIGLSYCAKGIFSFLLFCAALYFFELPQAIFAMSFSFLAIFVFFDFKRVTRRPNFTPKAVMRDIIRILLPSFVFVLQSLTYFAMTFYTRYVIEKVYSIEELGYFSSITLVMFVLTFLTGPALNVFIPGLSGLYADKKYYVIKRMTFRMGLCVIGITAAMCASSLVWGRFALRLIFGEEILAYSYLLIPTLIASGFMLGTGVLGAILAAMQRRIEGLIAGVAAMLTGILTCPVFVREFYMGGSIYSIIAAYTVQGFILLGFLLHYLKKPSNLADKEKGKFVL